MNFKIDYESVLDMIVETENKPKIATILQQLIDRSKIRPSDLIAQTGLPHNTVYMILNGKVNVPNGATLMAFADYFNVTMDYLVGREPNNKEEDDFIESVKGLIFIPIIQWSNINDWFHYQGSWVSRCKKSWGNPKHKYIEFSDQGSTNAFALQIDRIYLARIFPESSLIIVNPKSEINDGDYVLIKDENENIDLWQINEFNQKQYIQALSIKSEATELKPPLTVLGKVVEHRKYYI